MVIRRGDIYYADLRPVVGSEQGDYITGWCPPGTYYTKRYGKQAQPDSDLCRHYIAHVKGKAANACCNRFTLLQHRKRFSCITRAASHDRQTAPSRKGMSSGRGYDPPDRRSTARQPGYHPYIDRAGLSNYTCKIEKYMIR